MAEEWEKAYERMLEDTVKQVLRVKENMPEHTEPIFHHALVAILASGIVNHDDEKKYKRAIVKLLGLEVQHCLDGGPDPGSRPNLRLIMGGKE